MTERAVEPMSCPYGVYEDWRANDPVHLSTDAGHWKVARHSDIIEAVLAEHRFSVNRIPYLIQQLEDKLGSSDLSVKIKPIRELFENMVILTDDAEQHRRRRNLADRAIKAFLADQWFETFAERSANELLDEAITEAKFSSNSLLGEPLTNEISDEYLQMDAMNDFARRLPGRVIPDALGIDEGLKYPLLKRFQQFAQAFPGNLNMREDKLIESLVGVEKLKQFFLERHRHYTEEADQLTDDEKRHMMYHFATAKWNRKPFSPDEFVAMCVFTLQASLETVGGLIGNSLQALLKQPDKMAEFQERLENKDNDFLYKAVWEFARFDSPIQSTPRIAMCPTDLGGKAIQENTAVSLVLASGNRDADAFPNKQNELDFHRSYIRGGRRSKNLSFGFGDRSCLGQHLVAIQVAAALKAIFERLYDVKLTNLKPEWREDLPDYRVLKHLYISFKVK